MVLNNKDVNILLKEMDEQDTVDAVLSQYKHLVKAGVPLEHILDLANKHINDLKRLNKDEIKYVDICITEIEKFINRLQMTLKEKK